MWVNEQFGLALSFDSTSSNKLTKKKKILVGLYIWSVKDYLLSLWFVMFVKGFLRLQKYQAMNAYSMEKSLSLNH